MIGVDTKHSKQVLYDPNTLAFLAVLKFVTVFLQMPISHYLIPLP